MCLTRNMKYPLMKIRYTANAADVGNLQHMTQCTICWCSTTSNYVSCSNQQPLTLAATKTLQIYETLDTKEKVMKNRKSVLRREIRSFTMVDIYESPCKPVLYKSSPTISWLLLSLVTNLQPCYACACIPTSGSAINVIARSTPFTDSYNF